MDRYAIVKQRKELKKCAHKTVKSHYVLLVFLTLLLASPYYYWQRYGLAEYYLFPIYIFILICFSGQLRKTLKPVTSSLRLQLSLT